MSETATYLAKDGVISNYSDPNRPTDKRRLPPTTKKSWEVGEIHQMHHEVIQRIFLGMRNVEIAQELGVSEQIISQIKNSQVVRERLDIMRGAAQADTVDLGKEIMELAPRALDLVREAIDGEAGDLGVKEQLKCAERLLDRAGFAGTKTVVGIHAHQHNHFTPDDIEDIKRRAREVTVSVEAIDV